MRLKPPRLFIWRRVTRRGPAVTTFEWVFACLLQLPLGGVGPPHLLPKYCVAKIGNLLAEL